MHTTDQVAGEARAWLARRGRTPRSAALELGWTEVYMSRRLRGQVPFNVADLHALAELLDVPVTVFFEDPTLAFEGVQSGRVVRKSAIPVLAAAA